MFGLGILAAWGGYSLLYFGLDIVTGGNDTLVSLVWPGRYRPTARDGAGSSSSAASGPSVGGGVARGGSGPSKPIPPGSIGSH